MIIQIKKLNQKAKLPEYAHLSDAGMDLFSVENVNIKPGERVVCQIGIAMRIPDGYVGLIWDKSGVASKSGIKTMGGVIDSGYRGGVGVVLQNLSKEDYNIKSGDQVAQMLIQKVESPKIEEVDNLDSTERGEGGFGSTGVR